MKRILLTLLVLAVLLTGCANTAEQEMTADTAATEPVDTGLYIPDSPVEQQTGGAVKAYALEQTGYYGLSSIGDRILLLCGQGQTQMQALSGEMCIPSGSVELPVDLREGGGQIINNGVAYYDTQSNEAVFLDSQLSEIKRISLPEGIQGMPVFAPDAGEIFYCLGQEIRGMDTQLGISRLIKSHSCETQMLQGTYFDGKLLLCSATDAMGEQNTLYISTENGMTHSDDKSITYLSTYEDQYLVERTDGTVRQWIYGSLDAEPGLLNVADDTVISAAQLGGAVGVVTDDTGTHLSFYELHTGKKTAAVTIAGFAEPVCLLPDRWSGSVWILTGEGAAQPQTLLRWNVKASAVMEETVYTGPVYTAQAPDKEGLEALQDRVDGLNRQHVTAIRIWQDAVKTNGGHVLEPEYQTGAIEACLNDLEQVLSIFPEGFLRKSVNTKIRICIVRSADGKAEATRFWDDGDAFVILPCGVDVKTEFIKAMGYIVDSHVLGNSPVLDQWQSMNPEGFDYGSQMQESLLEGQNRAFADAASMSAVTEDRARIFYEAMQADNAAMFETQIMQGKLLLLCQAIRDAWRLERKTETYPWEQYLTQPIAYVE